MCCGAARYGPVYAVSLGSVSAVVLNNLCTISDAFETKAHIFSDRPNWLPLMSLIYRERGNCHRRAAVLCKMREIIIIFVLRLRNDLYCVEWGVKLYFNQHLLTRGSI